MFLKLGSEAWWRGAGLLLASLLCTDCGSSDKPAAGAAAAGSGGTGAAGSAAGGFAGAVMTTPGGPVCGLGSNAAFCDTFDAAASTGGRTGELDASKWSAARQAPQSPIAMGLAEGITKGSIPSCRSGLASSVFPDQDTLICDPTADIASNHLLVAAVAQNYGQNSYRIRQPFDFAGRTGKIVFDAEGYTVGSLFGWISLEVTEDPIPGPSFAVGGIINDEGSVLPKNGFEIQFQDPCNGYATPPAVGMRMLLVLNDYVGTSMAPPAPVCLVTRQGGVNHFEVSVSQSHIAVYGTDVSPDGTGYPELKLLYETDVNLPFSRGYVDITTHNHATKKYSALMLPMTLDDWIARWDNVGFDGPKLSNFREYSVPDALVSGTSLESGEAALSIGYRVADAATGPAQALHFSGVDLTGVSSARLAISTWYLVGGDAGTFKLSYRLNGGAWHDRALSSEEAGILTGGISQGQLGQMIDVDKAELVAGDNTVEFTTNAPQNYPPIVSNVDLILSE